MKIDVEKIYNGDTLEINGRNYKFEKPPFPKARKLFSFFGRIFASSRELSTENVMLTVITYLDDDKFLNEIDPIIRDFVTYNGVQLSKMNEHFEKYQEDVLPITMAAIEVFCSPFLKGVK